MKPTDEREVMRVLMITLGNWRAALAEGTGYVEGEMAMGAVVRQAHRNMESCYAMAIGAMDWQSGAKSPQAAIFVRAVLCDLAYWAANGMPAEKRQTISAMLPRDWRCYASRVELELREILDKEGSDPSQAIAQLITAETQQGTMPA